MEDRWIMDDGRGWMRGDGRGLVDKRRWARTCGREAKGEGWMTGGDGRGVVEER